MKMKKALERFLSLGKKDGLNAYLIITVVFSAYLFLIGCISVTPVTTSYDPAMHAEIVDPIILTQLYPMTWSPLADTGYTYPPLFHWLAFLVSRFGIEPIAAAVAIGVILYAVFPIFLYRLGSLWGRKIGLLSALSGTAISAWSAVFLAGEYPQLLAMNLSVVFLFFYMKKDYLKSGIFLGLTALSHPFVPVYLALFVFICMLIEAAKKNRASCIFSLKCLAVALIVASVWLPQYVSIVQSASTHQWRNVRWYYRPGFVDADGLNSLFLSFAPGTKINPVIFLLSLAGAGAILKESLKKGGKGNKNKISGKTHLLALFLFTLAFSIFHIPGTQYKFPDMLSVSVPVLFATGVYHILAGIKNNGYAKGLFITLVAFVLLFSVYGIGGMVSSSYSYRQKAVSTDSAREAAMWLRSYDPGYSRIVKTGDDEVWFSVLSHKYAMDPMITDLEVLTDGTNAQMRDREIIVEGVVKGGPVSGLAEKYAIKYVITEGIEPAAGEGRLIYEKGGVRIYEFPGRISKLPLH